VLLRFRALGSGGEVMRLAEVRLQEGESLENALRRFKRNVQQERARKKSRHEQTWHDGNGHSHLQATLLGPSLTVPIADGKLVLGTWQQIFHLEYDVRGRQRTVLVTVVGD